jgi:hypothetical protein
VNALVRTGNGSGLKTSVTLENCTVSAVTLALLNSAGSSLNASGKHCFFDMFDAPMRAPGLPQGDVLRLLTWRGEGNAWQLPGALINFSNDPETRSHPIPGISTLDQLRRLFPGSDTDSFQTTETFRERLATRRVNPSIVQNTSFALPESIAQRAPFIGMQSKTIGPE